MPTRLAVLIDADNISATLASDVFRHVAELGIPIVRRLYGKPAAISSWEKAAKDECYELRPQLGLTPAKNGADIALVIGAMDILYADMADAFCIVSNDRDFVPLAVRLRAVNRQVHAITTKSDDRLNKVFDSVFDLTQVTPILDAFRKMVAAADRQEFGLSEVGKMLREFAPPGAIPPPGKGKLRKLLEETGLFSFTGSGASIRVRLKAA